MSRLGERVTRKWNSETSEKNDSSSTEESSSASENTENSRYVKKTSTPLQSKWKVEQINRSPRNGRDPVDSEGTEEKSSDEEGLERFQRRKELAQDDQGNNQEASEHKKGIRGQKARYDRRGRRNHDRHVELESEKRKGTSGSQSSGKRHERGDLTRSRKKNRDFRGGENELPITEILKRSQENARVKYEQQPPLSELTTDKIYVQHRGGFSAMKINRLRGSGDGRKTEMGKNDEILERQSSPPIKVAISVQKLWKSAGLVFQGILGGMALMHFIMLYGLFNVSMEFVIDHSIICEIYTSTFSFLIALSIVSAFDKFDVARFDMEHLREIYFDYNKSVFAVPLYLIIFCLHQVCLNTDQQLALVHYYNLNDSLWENATSVQELLDDLNSWQKISVSKDILAVLSWLFVSFGTNDDAFLHHLQSMEKNANDADCSR